MNISDEKILENKKRFIEILRTNVEREGLEELISWLKYNTDFFEAPASSKYHLNIKGGLCQHSLNVYDKIRKDELYKCKCSDESITIVTLLHDLCKANFYKLETRNVKNEKTGQWEKVPFYKIDDQFPYGHGEKSAFLAGQFISLSPEEAMAIRYHMGIDTNDKGASSKAFNMNPLLVYLFISDLENTFIYENDNLNCNGILI